MILPVGTTLQGGKYKIVRFINRGGFGCTYEVLHVMLDQRLAIKEFFMRDYCNRDKHTHHITIGVESKSELVKKLQKKFVDEARVLYKLHHPGIVSVSDVFEENGTAYYAMEYIEGRSLQGLINERGSLPEQEALGYIRQVCDALRYVHEQNRLHLDIKPDNIMLTRQGKVILIDFGTSKHYDEESGENTSTLMPVHTPGYAPIEQVMRLFTTFKPSVDIYAIGATLYKMLTGNTPPVIIKSPLPFPNNISVATRQAIVSAMKYNEEDRPQSVDAFLKILEGKQGVIVAGGDKTSIENSREKKYDNDRTLMDNEAEKKKREANKIPPVSPQLKPTPVPPKPIPVVSKPIPQYQSNTSYQSNDNHKWKRKIGYIVFLSLCIAVFLLSISSIVLFEVGNKHYNAKEYAEAIPYYRKAAILKHKGAQNNLGHCYSNGWGVEKDYTQAVYWYRKAAEQRNAYAQCSLGLCYYEGKGVEKDYTQAVYWFRKAVEQGNASAQYSLGRCYYEGKGVEKDYTQAVYWYRKAAEQGNSSAQNSLGNRYYYGEGVEKDYTQAVYWYRKAAEQGDASAQYSLGRCYYEGMGVEKDYTQAVYWYRKAAEQGNASAQNSLGNRYYNGEGVEKDYTQAVYWFRKAAEQGNASAQNRLGNRYYNGEGVEKDYTQAVYWFRKAAEQGYASAQYNLGNCYENGWGVKKDYSQAVYWFRKAAEQGDTDAKRMVQELEKKGY